MKGIFVHDAPGEHYAWWIVCGYKTIETRKKNMLSALVGETVAIVKTETGKKPEIIGYAEITRYEFCPVSLFEMYRPHTMIPHDSKYNRFGSRDGVPGKWFYYLNNARSCVPYLLPDDAVRHGRSWCEF